MSGWEVTDVTESAAALHADPPPPDHRLVRVCRVLAPAVVLGSTQPADDVDADRAAALGLSVARRRSGGGAVLLVPGDDVWVDLGVPAGDPLWEADVGRATWWVGHAWAAALADLGATGATVHCGALVRNRWSARACFAGLGPGEVTRAGRKLLGVSQRRTRAGSLFQTSVPLRWAPAPLADVLGLAVGDLDDVAVGLGEIVPGVTAAAVVAALLVHLPR